MPTAISALAFYKAVDLATSRIYNHHTVGVLKKNLGLKIGVTALGFTLIATFLLLVVIGQMRLQIAPENTLGVFTLFSLFFIFFEFLLTVLLVNLYISRPIDELYHCMQKAGEGNLSIECLHRSDDELGKIASSFNRMVKGLGEMNETRKRIEQRLIKTEESLKYKVALEDKAKIIERMNTELTDAFNNVALLYTVSQYLNSVLDLSELTANVQKIFEEKFKCDQYALYFTGPIDDELQLACYKGFRNQNRWEEHRVKFGEGIAGKVAMKARTLYLENMDLSLDDNGATSELEKRLHGSVLSLPLMVRGVTIGVITVARSDKDTFSATDRQSIHSIASQIAVAYDRCKLYTRTKELAVRDELTGIYNRRHFQQMLELELKRAERYKRPISILMIDVDHFKKYNDSYGHLRGDDMLKQLARLLKRNLREVDLLARYGGEEFVVMLTDTALNDAISVAGKLRELVKINLKIAPLSSIASAAEAPPSSVTISIGVSSYPECANTSEELLNSSDMALYMAKRKGRDRVYAYQIGSLPLEELMTKMGFIH